MQTFKINDETIYHDIRELEFVKVLDKSKLYDNVFISPKFYTKTGCFYNIFEYGVGLIATGGNVYKELEKVSFQDYEKYYINNFLDENNTEDRFSDEFVEEEDFYNFSSEQDIVFFNQVHQKGTYYPKTKDGVWRKLEDCFEDNFRHCNEFVREEAIAKMLDLIDLLENKGVKDV